MNLTKEELDILAHILVEDPQQWADRAEQNGLGRPAVDAKIEKYRADYEANKNKPGYKTGKERQAQRDAERETRLAADRQAKADKKAAEDAAMDAKIAAIVEQKLRELP